MQKTNKLIYMVPVLLTIVLFIFGLTSCDGDKAKQENTQHTIISVSAISLNNQGVGEMGMFDYSKATETFEKVVANNQDWELAQQNLAIALLNRQKPEDEARAIAIAEKLMAKDANNLVAQYIVAILKFNQGLCEQALPRFQTIIKTDSKDAYALYFAAQCFLQNGEVPPALELYQKAIKADPYLRSAYYGGFMAAQRSAQTELAKQMLAAYQKLASNPKARLAEIKYTRMGPKANAQGLIQNKPVSLKTPQAPFFQEPKLLAGFDSIQQFGIVNIEQTKTPQLYVIQGNTLNVYTDFLEQPKAIDKLSIDLNFGKHLLAWGDINNDGKIDVYVTGENDQLYLQADVGFIAVDMMTFGLKQLSSKAVRLIDADHDGDLDVLLLSQTGRFEIWNNNLNNTFTALSKKTALPTDDGFLKILIQDIDADRDADIILLSSQQFVVLRNDRMWDYESIYSPKYKSPLSALTIADNNINGLPELNILSGKNIFSLEFDHQTNSFKEIKSIDGITEGLFMQFDVNGNGRKEFLVQNNDGIKIYTADGQLSEQILLNSIQSIKTLNSINGPELLLLQSNKLLLIPASKNRLPFVLLNFSGKEDEANSVRSNYSGIGTSVVLRNQEFYATANSFQNFSGSEQDYQAIALAAGTKNPMDFIAMEWSDGVYQTELGLTIGAYHKITETQRQLSSCPVIFAWNNGQYEFISDILGVAGIGFAIGRHQYGEPRPWENYLLTEKQLQAQDGVFKLQFTEPMEESAYLDSMQIEAYDVPESWFMTLDERMMISAPQVTGKPLFYQSITQPIQVLNNWQEDVTDAALEIDKIAIEINNTDERFLGLVDEQIITMEFADELLGDYHFLLNGWVEYGYSQSMFAAWQSGLVAQAPTIEYKVNGQWKVLLKEFGYPAGMPRAATVPLSIPQATKFLRIRTNMEIYFDQLGIIKTKTPESIVKYDLKLNKATLKQLGFPKRTNNHQRVPSYDFNDIQPFWDTRYMEGAYTQLGEVTKLLTQEDNALAIIAAGEGIELEFTDNLPAIEAGFNRYYLLKFKGWAKDMDILTKNGETLTPIPVDENISINAEYLNNKYNTRFKAGK